MENRLKDFLHKNKRWDSFLKEFQDDLVSGEPVLGILYSHNNTFVSDGVSVPQVKFDFSPSSLLFVYSPYTATNSALSYSDIRGYFRLYSSNDLKGTGLQNLWDSLSELNEQKVSGEELDTLEEKINTQLNSYYATKGYVTSTFSDNYVERDEIGRAGGVAYLDSSGKIPLRNLYESQSIRVLKAANETEHLTLGSAIGDFVLRTDQDRIYIRSSDARGMAAYEVIAYRKASDLIFTPYGDLLSTNIQKAIEELEDNKVTADDPRLSDSRNPNAHSSTHSYIGSDPLSPSDIGASSEDHDHDYAPATHINSLEHPEATSTSRGFMSSSHFNKLEGVEEGAAADQSSQEILDSLKTVDGSGSGLDADTLRGDTPASFAPASHVGSRNGHPLATPTQNGLYPAVDKAKLDTVESGARPIRHYEATNMDYDYNVSLPVGWTNLGRDPVIDVPALGQPPSGTRWKLYVGGFLRLFAGPVTTVYVVMLPEGSTSTFIGGGGRRSSTDDEIYPYDHSLDPPTLSSSFRLVPWIYVLNSGTYRIRSAVSPYCRIELVKV